MTTAPEDTTFKDVVKAISVAAEARGRLAYDRLLLRLHKRNVERQAVLTKWLWKKIFVELQRELAKPNRDIKRVAELVATMRKLIPPPPSRNDDLAASFSDAFQRARQRAAEEEAEQASFEEEQREQFEAEADALVPDDESAGDPTDVGTREDLEARRTRSTDFFPRSQPYGGPFPHPYGLTPFD